MFLPFFIQLRKNQPKLFYLFGLFFILQLLFVLIKLEVTPFFLYGMYSEKVEPAATFTETKLWVNGKEWNTDKLWMPERLLIEETVQHYLNIKENKGIDIVQSRVEQRYGFLTQSFIYPFLKERIYNRPAALTDYEQWLKEKSSAILNESVSTISIQKNIYQINPARTHINPISSETVARF